MRCDGGQVKARTHTPHPHAPFTPLPNPNPSPSLSYYRPIHLPPSHTNTSRYGLSPPRAHLIPTLIPTILVQTRTCHVTRSRLFHPISPPCVTRLYLSPVYAHAHRVTSAYTLYLYARRDPTTTRILSLYMLSVYVKLPHVRLRLCTVSV